MKKYFKTIGLCGFILMMIACGEKTDVVDSGIYQGVAKEVEPEKTKIYVETEDDKTLKLYVNTLLFFLIKI